MTSIDLAPPRAQPAAAPAVPAGGWGNSAPLSRVWWWHSSAYLSCAELCEASY
jgi:hypothetical protein